IYQGPGTYYPDAVSRDGRYLLFEGPESASGDFNVFYLPLGSAEKPVPFLHSQFHETHPNFSPDGHWVAYSSNESGHPEVYVVSFPDARTKFQISTEGGDQAQWRDDGRELYYLGLDLRLMAVAVQAGPDLHPSKPQALFATNVRASGIL